MSRGEFAICTILVMQVTYVRTREGNANAKATSHSSHSRGARGKNTVVGTRHLFDHDFL
jgi:hypothetical protein